MKNIEKLCGRCVYFLRFYIKASEAKYISTMLGSCMYPAVQYLPHKTIKHGIRVAAFSGCANVNQTTI